MFKVKKEITGLLRPITGLFNEKTLITSSAPVFLPFYHYVGDSPSFLEGLYDAKSTKAFKRDLEYMQHHFTFINSNELEDLVNGVKNDISFDKPPLHLSFDDGLSCCYHTIAPILKEKNIPATFFVSPYFHEGEDVFYRYKIGLLIHFLKNKSDSEDKKNFIRILKEFGKWKKSLIHSLLLLVKSDDNVINQLVKSSKLNIAQEDIYMTIQQLQDLRNQGFSIGGHSQDHPMYNGLSIEEQLTQTLNSVEWVVKNFNMDQKLFAFPFTDSGVGSDFFEKTLQEKKVDLIFGTAGLKKGYYPGHLQRVPMEMYGSSPKARIKTEYLYHHISKLIFRKQ